MTKRFVLLLVLTALMSLPLPAAGKDSAAADSALSSRPDVDLTSMSSTMVFSQVFIMLMEPANFIGKRIRMRGIFLSDQVTDDRNPEKTETWFACQIADATACCSQGLLFVPRDSSLPSLLKDGDEITVDGTFEVFTVQGEKAVRLVDSIVTRCDSPDEPKAAQD